MEKGGEREERKREGSERGQRAKRLYRWPQLSIAAAGALKLLWLWMTHEHKNPITMSSECVWVQLEGIVLFCEPKKPLIFKILLLNFEITRKKKIPCMKRYSWSKLSKIPFCDLQNIKYVSIFFYSLIVCKVHEECAFLENSQSV